MTSPRSESMCLTGKQRGYRTPGAKPRDACDAHCAVLPAATATDIWELSGVPVSALAEGTVMQAEDCVDAALAGLDLGEAITLPSVNDPALLASFTDASLQLFGAAQNGKPAPRYLATA